MIRINQIKLSAFVEETEVDSYLRETVARKLHVDVSNIDKLSIYRRSLDARDNTNPKYVYTVDVLVNCENKLKYNDNNIVFVDQKDYSFEYHNKLGIDERPIVVGFGPAGLFCSYMLAKAGFRPIILERGKCIEERFEDVNRFWETGILNPDSNVQFGEGGAGTFSDGKLNTLVKDKSGKIKEVLKIFVKFGAPSNILFDNKPHIGTDILRKVVANMRDEIINLKAKIYYETKVTDVLTQNGRIIGVVADDKKFLSNDIIFAIGHSARDTFEMLNEQNITMTPKPFAVGFRVMHPQETIDANQYGVDNLDKGLPSADYKLTYTSSNNRGVYSFCMCPGGFVVNASSEENMIAINGMSYHNRDSKVANSAIVVQVTPDDYPESDALAGVRFQRELERKAYIAGNGNIPIQRYKCFERMITNRQDSCIFDEDTESLFAIKGAYSYADLTNILPSECNKSFVEGMQHFSKQIDGFCDENVYLAGVESRTSSPVRIERNDDGISSLNGLFPCGEGAGYAGGITSAALDGIYIAECVARSILGRHID